MKTHLHACRNERLSVVFLVSTFAFAVLITSLTLFSQTCRADDISVEPTLESKIPGVSKVCGQQFDLVLQELKKLEKQFPVMSGFQKSVRVEHQDSKDGVLHFLSYDNNFSGRSKSGKQSYAIDTSRSYAA